VARALISRLEAAESLPNSWLFEVGVDQYQGQPLRARALSLQLTTAQGSQAWLGPRLVPPQSQLLAYGPASPVNRSVKLVLRTSYAPSPPGVRCLNAHTAPGTGHTLRWHAERDARLRGKASTQPPPIRPPFQSGR
jgi:hypothetical protein